MFNRKLLVLLMAVFIFNGCAVIFQKGRRTDLKTIETLRTQVNELEQAQIALRDKLAQEIQDKQVSLRMAEKGLVITFVAEVLYDSGKAVLRPESLSILDKVANIIKSKVPDNNIGIEGHTDNDPIKYSRWESNWELSSHRALSVLHYLQSDGVRPERLSAIGYGEYHPMADNSTKEGRQLNRRVEIVILPKTNKERDEDVIPEIVNQTADMENDWEELK
ncbi:MAG: OmpA family protein [Candidatus Omnitrophica bacterium]|jgi:chemotaxis protein MotB|nr:OmpA family protein [Candidatus Omnitrophota bacterium]MDD5080491.1 OmpA family protein [Candidatus Omnitrophota bacterium]MDD5440751.1 OmpA family protein [Candidatus Omnitrophota bacterium]